MKPVDYETLEIIIRDYTYTQTNKFKVRNKPQELLQLAYDLKDRGIDIITPILKGRRGEGGDDFW